MLRRDAAGNPRLPALALPLKDARQMHAKNVRDDRGAAEFPNDALRGGLFHTP